MSQVTIPPVIIRALQSIQEAAEKTQGGPMRGSGAGAWVTPAALDCDDLAVRSEMIQMLDQLLEAAREGLKEAGDLADGAPSFMVYVFQPGRRPPATDEVN